MTFGVPGWPLMSTLACGGRRPEPGYSGAQAQTATHWLMGVCVRVHGGWGHGAVQQATRHQDIQRRELEKAQISK